ncbi:MAG: hypothetical protein KAJ07_02010 [Planctomycetes bacterium]|nr:hypothetical protein [Planctomycetota bacterium]
MALVKKSFPIVLAVLAVLLVINTAIAAILPESSYVSPDGIPVNNNTLRDGSLRIDYAVYDTENIALGSDEEDFLSSFMATQYVYAYQVYNDNGSALDIGSFNLSYIGNDAIEGDDHISSMVDDLGNPGDQNNRGTEPSDNDYGFDSDTRFDFAKWEFNSPGSFLEAGDHSYWLIIQSNNAPKRGLYSMGGVEDIEADPENSPDQIPDIVNVPEPITITLLGIGGLILRRTGKKA